MQKKERVRSRSRHREVEPSLWRHIGYGVLACSLVLILGFSVWYVTRLQTFTITKIDVEGGETISHDDVRDIAESVLSGAYMKLIPYRFTFFYPESELLASIGAIPRLHEVTAHRTKGTLTISFTEYEPYALWCTAEDDTPRCYFLDKTGYAFAGGPRLTGGAFVRHVQEGNEELEKKQVFPNESFANMHAFLEQLTNELSIRVTDVFYTKEGDVRLSVNGGGTLLIRAEESYETTFENLKSVLASPEFEHIEPGNFRYVDLRFGNKIFVNEQMEEATTTTENTSTSSTPE